jgi:hypothetical protein
MEQSALMSGNGIYVNGKLRAGDINQTAASLMEEKLRDIQKEIDEIISQAVEYKKQGNHILLSGYLACGIMRLNQNIERVLAMVEMIKDIEKQAG